MTSDPLCSNALVAAVPALPGLVAGLPASLGRAAAIVLPSEATEASRERTWAPVLAWIVMGALPEELRTRAVFEDLQMKSALAEAFSALGLDHETAWRVAAQVKSSALLPLCTAARAGRFAGVLGGCRCALADGCA